MKCFTGIKNSLFFVLLISFNITVLRGQKAIGSKVRCSSNSMVRKIQPSEMEINKNPRIIDGVSFLIQSFVTGMDSKCVEILKA